MNLSEQQSGSRLVFGLPPTDVAVTVVMAALLLAAPAFTLFPSWTPRMVVLLAVSIPAVVVLAAQSRSDWPARAAIGFVMVVWLTSLLSSAPRTSALGVVGRDLSAVTVTVGLGLWALSRNVSERGRPVFMTVFMWAVAGVAIVGIVQVVAQIRTGSLALYGDRPSSSLVNPVYFGAICASGAVVASRSGRRDVDRCLVAAVVSSIGCTLSGSRAAIAAMVVVTLAWLVVSRSRRAGFSAGAVAVGVLAGMVIDTVFSAGRGSLDRVGSSEGGGRLTVWRYGMEAFFDKPLMGYGVGRFRPAVQGRFSVSFVRDFAFDDQTQPWFDAHNVVIGLLVATGVLGLLAWCAWLLPCVRQARGAGAAACLVIGLTWLLQPASLHTLPVAMMLLGVSMPLPLVPGDGTKLRQSERVVVGTACAVSLAWALGLLVADLRLKSASLAPDSERAASAAAWFGDDPVVADVVAQVAHFEAGPGAVAEALRWRRRATAAEPDRPYWWTQLGQEQLAAGDIAGAEASTGRALQLQPTNVTAIVVEADIAFVRADEQGFTEALDQLCALGQPTCDIDPKAVLAAQD